MSLDGAGSETGPGGVETTSDGTEPRGEYGVAGTSVQEGDAVAGGAVGECREVGTWLTYGLGELGWQSDVPEAIGGAAAGGDDFGVEGDGDTVLVEQGSATCIT